MLLYQFSIKSSHSLIKRQDSKIYITIVHVYPVIFQSTITPNRQEDKKTILPS